MQTLEKPLRSTAEHLVDTDITAAIELFFLTKKGVTSHLIDVTTRDGIVALTGSTDSLLSRQRAEEIAMAVRGVRGVVNELVVCADDVSSAELTLNVGRALADDPATRNYNLRCTVSGGMVWLAGTVQSWSEKQLALRVVEGVRGVRQIVADQLMVSSSGAQRSDEEITTQLGELLDWDIRINKKLLRVHTTNRVVHLAGTVGSAAAKARIEKLAFEAGAVRVDTRDLCVARWALGPEREEEDFMRSDEDIGQAVRDTCSRDPRLQDITPVVQVKNGVVSLSGTVSNLLAKQAAEQDAHHVVGVSAVQSQLRVRSDRFWPDDDIRQRVAEALRRNPYLSSFHFSVHVSDSKVTLHGWVDNRFEQEQAYNVAAGINGVTDVENRVTVFPDGRLTAPAPAGEHPGHPAPAAPAVGSDDLAERIRTRFFWSACLHDQPIEVQAENKTVTLNGTVDTWLERQLAAHEARELGASEVHNHLRVRFSSPALKT